MSSLHPEKDLQEEENFKEAYNLSGQKEAEITNLRRIVDDLETENEELKVKHRSKVENLEVEMNDYIKVIIDMKLSVAEYEMKASEKMYLYNQLKKKMRMESLG